jgi:hypothetical protein
MTMTLQEASRIAYDMDVLHSRLLNELRAIQGRAPFGDCGAPVFDSLYQVLEYTRNRGAQIAELRSRISALSVVDVCDSIKELGITAGVLSGTVAAPERNTLAETITAVEFLKRIQDKIKATDVGSVNTIVGVSFYADGEPAARYSLSNAVERTETILEVIALCLEGTEL